MDVRTKVDHVKDFDASVVCDARDHCSVCGGGSGDDGCEVSAVVFDKFDALFLFLPKLEVSIDRRRNKKASPSSTRQ